MTHNMRWVEKRKSVSVSSGISMEKAVYFWTMVSLLLEITISSMEEGNFSGVLV